ncbi:MAG: hypothetical protein JEY71_07610 [Sphaerochaeta sp.]|nr:hypothetical protein [Sphaerochaeta sp.]
MKTRTPSGNLEPSVEDRVVTRRLRQAEDIIGIKVLDHLVFSVDMWISKRIKVDWSKELWYR